MSYSTALDHYMNAVFVFLIAVFSENGLVQALGPDDHGALVDVDRLFFYVAAGVWVAFNLLFAFGAWRYVRRTRRLLKSKVGL